MKKWFRVDLPVESLSRQNLNRKRSFSAAVQRPFLIQSDSASRKRPFSTGLFFDWILLILVIVSRVDFVVFVLIIEAVYVRECTAVWRSTENRLAALCFARSSRATRASRAANFRLSGLVALGLAESRQGFVRGVALSREPPKLTSITRAAAVVWYVLLAGETRNAPR